MKRHKQGKDRPLNARNDEEEKADAALPRNLDLRDESEQSTKLLVAFTKHVASLNLEKSDKVQVKQALTAISSELSRIIPGWKNLKSANMNKSNPLYKKVY